VLLAAHRLFVRLIQLMQRTSMRDQRASDFVVNYQLALSSSNGTPLFALKIRNVI
jgi:hypothetical protein